MARRYDSRTTIFSPEGRLYQVEYAMEAIGHDRHLPRAILASDGIVLAAVAKKHQQASRRSVHRREDLQAARRHGVQRGWHHLGRQRADQRAASDRPAVPATVRRVDPLPSASVSWLSRPQAGVHSSTAGKRSPSASSDPCTVGWDKHYGYRAVPSRTRARNYGGWKATCIGNNSAAAVSILKQEYKENETTLKDALALAIKVLSKTLDMTKLTADKLEMATLTRDTVRNKTTVAILSLAQVEKLIKKHEQEEAKLEASKKEKEREKRSYGPPGNLALSLNGTSWSRQASGVLGTATHWQELHSLGGAVPARVAKPMRAHITGWVLADAALLWR
uniref:Putative proteasome subunit alpha type-4-like protein n=1 Tax=Ixodes ricinus TaxID=34613 RepID=A0A090XEF6_IXORI